MIVPLAALHKLGHALNSALGARSRAIDSGRRRVWLYDFPGRGAGPPLVLVHGLGGNAHSFARVVRAAQRMTTRLIVPELPGHGRSAIEKGDAPLAIEELGQSVLDVLADLGRPALLVGNSLGGALTLHALLERPDLTLGWIGLAPAGAPLTAQDRASLRDAFAGGIPAARALQRKLFHKVPAAAWLVLRDFARYWRIPEVERMVAAVLSAEVALALDRLRARHRPALVLWGESDRLLPVHSVVFFREHLGPAAVELVPRCGHLPMVERPRLVAARLRQFIAALPPSA